MNTRINVSLYCTAFELIPYQILLVTCGFGRGRAGYETTFEPLENKAPRLTEHRYNEIFVITNTIQKLKRLAGHIQRKDTGNIGKEALFWTPDGKRKRGRTKKTWRRSAAKELASVGFSSSVVG